MSHISIALKSIQAAHEMLGTAEMARRAGLPYTTLSGWVDKGFCHSAIELFIKLEAVANELSNPSADAPMAASAEVAPPPEAAAGGGVSHSQYADTG